LIARWIVGVEFQLNGGWPFLTRGDTKLEEIRGPDRYGNRIYVMSIGKKCLKFWTVDAQGIITGGRHEGSACKYLTN
jgi:hypothetical protein